MSRYDDNEPDCDAEEKANFVRITPKAKDLGGFSVKRVLPASQAPRIGPFVFFDEMGPAEFPPGEGINVRPHPHIGLATVTFLFDGEILHQDSLGFTQPIQPGAVNLMTAGKGIVHSERTSNSLLENGQRLHGIQVWMALPEAKQEIEPEFIHYPETALPVVQEPGITTTVIIGEYAGSRSPVAVHVDTVYLQQHIKKGTSTSLPLMAAEIAIYVVAGNLEISGCLFEPGQMAALKPGALVETNALSDCHIMIVGGESVGPRHLWWNFVHTSTERIEQAKSDWKNMDFAMVPNDDEFIPLPDS